MPPRATKKGWPAVNRPALALWLVVCLLAGCDPVTSMAVGGVATVGVGSAEERGFEGAVDDSKIVADIDQRLFQSNVGMFHDVTVTVTEGRVVLTGSVKSPDSKVEAVRLTWQAAGVHEVTDDIQVTDNSGFLDYTRDARIANELRADLLFDKNVRNVNYTVDVVNGVVYLMGIAQDQDELDRVVNHARNIDSVKQVINHIVLKTDPRRQAL
jgi:osmotically-inducible protein OsmY